MAYRSWGLNDFERMAQLLVVGVDYSKLFISSRILNQELVFLCLLETPEEDVDIYTPVAIKIDNPVIEIHF